MKVSQPIEQEARKVCCRPQPFVKVHLSGTEDSVGLIAISVLEPVAGPCGVHGLNCHVPSVSGRYTGFAAKSVSLASLALADALKGRLVNTVDFVLSWRRTIRRAPASGSCWVDRWAARDGENFYRINLPQTVKSRLASSGCGRRPICQRRKKDHECVKGDQVKYTEGGGEWLVHVNGQGDD